MPTPYVEKLAKKHGVSVDKAESEWEKAKKDAADGGHSDDYAYVTQIFKSRMGETAKVESAVTFSFQHRLLAADGVLVAAGALILSQATSRVLLVLRSPDVDDPNTWCGVGGKVDFGETPPVAVKREVFEEVGYRGPMELYPALVYKDEDLRFHNYLGVVQDEFKPKLNWETTKARWIQLNK